MRAYGLTPFHRRSFPAVHATIAGEQQVLGFEFDPDLAAFVDDELAEAELLVGEIDAPNGEVGIPMMADELSKAVFGVEDLEAALS
jgi:hypothetical protein